ncbi:MAG TPA: NAD(P)-dependent oxidoreductase [Phycisphaerae bacterium]|nr:NAD(P)-dependent oxidoreductase [Phycisphaerae bacterium]
MMTNLPETIKTVSELEEVLTSPSAKLVEFMKTLDGDIMILGAGGKIGPTLAEIAKHAVDKAGVKKDIIAVDVVDLPALKAKGIKTIKCNMLNLEEVQKLPKAKNIIFMVGRKFGSDGAEHLTWAINVMVPHNIAQTFTDSRIAVFSTGCVYPVMDIKTGGATELIPANPVGEYAMSSLGRERMFDYFSHTACEKVVIIRLNYALDLRYGVICDIATKVFNGQPLDITTGYANGIWQGDACDQIIRSLSLASAPSTILNVTGPELFSIRQVANQFGEIFGKTPIIEGQENGLGYISNAAKANGLFGYPSIPLEQVIKWVAAWIQAGGENIGKPTHFETQNGKY